jgi:hypothetical protein
MEERKQMILVFESRQDGSRYRRPLQRLRERYGDFHIKSGTLHDGRIRVCMNRVCRDTVAVRRDLGNLARSLSSSAEWTAVQLAVCSIGR